MFQIVSTLTFGAPAVSLGPDESLLVLPGTSVIGMSTVVLGVSLPGVGVVVGTGFHALDIQGTVYGDVAGLGVSSADRVDVQIGPEGSVGSLDQAIFAEVPTTLTNQGSITAGGSAVTLPFWESHRLVNFGGILSSSGTGVDIVSGNPIINHGEISGHTGVSFHSVVLGASLYNSGVIIGTTDAAVRSPGLGSQIETIVNSGTIDGGVKLFGGPDAVINDGLIREDVDLGDQGDIYQGQRDGLVIGTVLGGQGNDTLTGAWSGDTLDGGEGDDEIHGRGDADSLLGGIGRDTIKGGAGDDVIDTGAWSDTAHGGAGDDLILAVSGNDLLKGGKGDDTITGAKGLDTARGGAGDDSISGADGFDELHGGAGDDEIDGGRQGDTLAGGAGDDILSGAHGFDIILGGKGADTLIGGDGNDTFVFTRGWGHDVILDFENGLDRIDLGSFALPNFASLSSFFTVSALNGAVLIDFGDGDSLLVNGIPLAQFDSSDVIL